MVAKATEDYKRVLKNGLEGSGFRLKMLKVFLHSVIYTKPPEKGNLKSSEVRSRTLEVKSNLSFTYTLILIVFKKL